jgi:hypothetical protein
MAETSKVLAQSAPSATSLTDAYTCGSSDGAVVSSLTVCNRSATQTSFRISVAIAGAGDANAQYLYYDVIIPGNDTFIATVGITLADTDVIRVYATLATLSFQFFGVELS